MILAGHFVFIMTVFLSFIEMVCRGGVINTRHFQGHRIYAYRFSPTVLSSHYLTTTKPLRIPVIVGVPPGTVALRSAVGAETREAMGTSRAITA